VILAAIHIQVTLADWGAVLPELIVAGGMLLLMLIDVFVPGRRINLTTWATLVILALAFAASWNLWRTGGTASALYGTITSDRFGMFFNFSILISAALAVLISPSYISRSAFDSGEYYALLLGAVLGMMLMAAGLSLMVLFIALELLSLSLYILSGFERFRPRSQEAGFKYFLLSSFASAFLIYGFALLYGVTGSTSLIKISTCLAGHAHVCSAAATSSPLLYIGIGLMLVGFAFKVSIVPFHMWTPDVYEGAPTPITAFMSVATKAALFAAFIRVFSMSLSSVESHWYGALWALAIATMVVGNVAALAQSNMKRLLAYSGIAHAGYILVAMAANNALGQSAVAFYFLAYAFMNIGAFVFVAYLETLGQAGDEISSYRGIFYRNPALALPMAIFMFSLAGFPPTAGFFAKYVAFQAAIQAGHVDLVVIGVITSLVSVFYYLRVIAVMFLQPVEEAAPAQQTEEPVAVETAASETVGAEPASAQPAARPQLPWNIDVSVWTAALGSIVLGILPTGLLAYATESVTAVRALFGLP
jgi:NADH-quinone oxidoreductase subunit N